jgi:hypothetical protein
MSAEFRGDLLKLSFCPFRHGAGFFLRVITSTFESGNCPKLSVKAIIEYIRNVKTIVFTEKIYMVLFVPGCGAEINPANQTRGGGRKNSSESNRLQKEVKQSASKIDMLKSKCR